MDDFYHPNDEASLAWDDPTINIQWPIQEDMEVILSEKDKHNPKLTEL